MKEKLVEIIDNVQKYCSHEGTYCCDCKYGTLDGNTCWKHKVADAIIESDLLKDETVYSVVEQEITIPQVACPKCGYFVGPSFDFISYSYCPGCGVKLKRNRRNHNA